VGIRSLIRQHPAARRATSSVGKVARLQLNRDNATTTVISTLYLPRTTANVQHSTQHPKVSALINGISSHNQHCPTVACGNR
jgi:hypothetical protein